MNCPGQWSPYLDVVKKHADKMELLPHAAADTEHVSRVEGAKQAVDQIFQAIQYRKITNLKGDLPAGYANAGAKTVDGVGKVTTNGLNATIAEKGILDELRMLSENMASIWGSLSAIDDPDRRAELVESYGSELIKSSNRYAALMAKKGLQGPFN